ncbi:MAG TPA: endonuclease MutS2 [Firmicutes bacterium]|nr:endonuclease MutS2 [Bacillota bacterium]
MRGSVTLDSRTLAALEFDKILDMLARETASALGSELAYGLSPSSDLQEVLRLQQETSEARRVLEEYGDPPLGGIRDIRPALARARVGSRLDAATLLDVLSTIQAARRLKAYLGEVHAGYCMVKDLGRNISTFASLESEISRAISQDASILDTASQQLRNIRCEMRQAEARVREKLDGMLRAPEFQKYLQEPIVTVRQGRFVVPVKQEFKAQVPGIVHDQSKSGATLFVEPMEIVALNNRIRELLAMEEEEIDRILCALTVLVGQEADDIGRTLDALGRLDFAFAKARLSSKMNAVAPAVNDSGYFSLVRARHPLLRGDVVPISPYLGRDLWTMVITGPNTGGKTVTLKTIGLIHLMAQSGLHVPAGPGTEICVFRTIFADIGDEQSIEQNLSTFSSHIVHIKEILEKADERTLVLLDELGAGTDPAEGSCLGRAILEHLHSRRCLTVVTTHLSDLKIFAYKTPGVINASTEFDEETLRPTYRLLVGVPGRSSAIVISRRLGLPSSVTRRAEELLGREGREEDSIISELLEDRRKADILRKEAESFWSEAQKAMEAAREELGRARDERRALISRSREDASRILREARHEAERIIGDLKDIKRQMIEDMTARAADDALRRAREAARELARAEPAMADEQPGDYDASRLSPVDPGRLNPGMHVFVPRLGKQGVVSGPPDGSGRVEVRVGAIRTLMPVSELKAIHGPASSARQEPGQPGMDGMEAVPAFATTGPSHPSLGTLQARKARDIQPELDLRGLLVEEALMKLDKYLDDAVLGGLPRARVIHGKGTGALRHAVRESLKSDPRIKELRPGEQGEGGDGVTVITLR